MRLNSFRRVSRCSIVFYCHPENAGRIFRRLVIIVVIAIGSVCCEKTPEHKLIGRMDWSGYEKSLKSYVSEGQILGVRVNLVSYLELANDDEFLALADLLANAQLAFKDKNEKLAFYINAYNYFAIKIVLDKKPKNSIRDIGNVVMPVWRRTVGQIAGEDVSLDIIEHEILRSMGEPRIHFAIVCASLSCPNLRQELYTAEKLDAQLDGQTRKFLNDETKGVSMKNGSLYISRIFDWFEEDFEKDGGVLPFLRRYRKDLGTNKEYLFMDYRWDLNALEQ